MSYALISIALSVLSFVLYQWAKELDSKFPGIATGFTIVCLSLVFLAFYYVVFAMLHPNLLL